MKESTKKIIITILAIMMISTFIKSLVLLGILLLVIQMFRGKKERIEKNEDELEVIDTQEHDILRMQAKLIEDKLNEKKKIMQEMDIRQFQGRNDVSIQEVIDYMIDFSQYIGLEKRTYQMERICQVCNLTMDDMKEVQKEIWGKCRINEDKEAKVVADYYNDLIKQLKTKDSYWQEFRNWHLAHNTKGNIEWIDKIISQERVKELEINDKLKDEKMFRRYDYDGWLKWKGYIK